MEQKGQNSHDSTNKKNELMETIRRALPVISIIAGILIIIWWIDSWLVLDAMSWGMCFGVMAPGVVGIFLIIIGIATIIRQRIDISEIFEKAKHNKHIFLRVIFVLILLLFIVLVIWVNPLSSGHLRLQYSLGRRDFWYLECIGCDLSGANLEEANFIYAKLREANMSGADLSDADLRGSDLSGADLSSADLSDADLAYDDLSGAELNGAVLNRARLYSADLSGADLSGADLRDANLRGANLSGADLSNADLSGADLSGADLSGADLNRSVLFNANLNGADLSGADLNGAELNSANLYRADLSGANVLIFVFNHVSRLQCTTMPNGMTYDGHLNLSGDLDIAKNSRPIDINDDEAMARFYCISLEEYIQGQERNGGY